MVSFLAILNINLKNYIQKNLENVCTVLLIFFEIHSFFKIKMFYNYIFSFFKKKTIKKNILTLKFFKNYKKCSKFFKLFKKINISLFFLFGNKNKFLYKFWWLLNLIFKFKPLTEQNLIFLFLNFCIFEYKYLFKRVKFNSPYKLNKSTKKFNRKFNKDFFKKFKFTFYWKKIKKRYFNENQFIKIQRIFWPIRYSSNEFCWTKSTIPLKKKIKGFFLRKTKSFYKGRYARNRQTCRVIVFWTLAFNLIWIYGLYFFFYQFSFNFGYLWWGLFFFYLSLNWSSILKHKLYNPLNIVYEFFYFFKWLSLLIKSIFN